MIGRRVGCTTSAQPRPSSPPAGASEPARGPSRHRRPQAHQRAERARATPTLAPQSRSCNGDGPGQRVRGFLRLCGAAHHRSRDTSRPAAAAASPPLARGARLGRVARRPIGRRRRRWRPQPAVARHPLDGPHCAPPLRGTAHQTLRRCWGQYWPIGSTGAFRCVRRSPAHCRTVVPPATGRCVDRLHDAVENSPRYRRTASSQTLSRSP